MKSKNYELMLDIYKGILNPQNIKFKTEDFDTCELTFNILEDMITPYNLTDCIVRMLVNDQQQDCNVVDVNKGKVSIVLQQSMLKEGQNVAELQIYDALNQVRRLTTPCFNYNVSKSLMDDNTVQADANYTILQEMILEVSNANEVANNAKTVAEGALVTANQAQAKAVEIMSNGDYAKAQGDYAKAKGDEVANKITLNSLPQTNFNFICSNVVQDGLVEVSSILGNVTKNITLSSDYTLILQLDKAKSGWFILNENFTNGWGLFIETDGRVRFAPVAGGTIAYVQGKVNIGEKATIIIKQSLDGSVYTFVNDVGGITNNTKLIKMPSIGTRGSDGQSAIKYIAYNKLLTPKEIQHNLSILNNAESINSVNVGDKKLLLSTDTDHVTDRTGRTQEQINRRAYKRSCKEFTSTGGAITVNNGEEGYVLSGEIKGNTFKNMLPTEQVISLIGNGTTFVNNYIPLSSVSLNPNSKYTLFVFVSENTFTNAFIASHLSLGAFTTECSIPSRATGIFRFPLTSKSSLEGISTVIRSQVAQSSETGTVKFQRVLVEGDVSQLNSYIPFGLSSTQAVISNNGNLYPIYEPTIQGKTRILTPEGTTVETGLVPTDPTLPALKDGDKLDLATRVITFANATTRQLTEEEVKAYWKHRQIIKLGSTTTKKDTLELKEDGSAIYTQNTKDATDGSARVDLTTPVVFSIDKSLMPTIATSDKINICQVESSVAPSSFKLTLPVDINGEQNQAIDALQKAVLLLQQQVLTLQAFHK